ncbi:MAG: 2OG-Fe(II) oxygenase [Halioglobus sp.]
MYAATAGEARYLDVDLMNIIDPREFRRIQPYPWANPLGLVRPEMLQQLIAELPPMEVFAPSFGYERKHGQQAHDRYVLDYTKDAPCSAHWHEFVGELCSNVYRDFVRRLLDVRAVKFSFQWHYTPRGASVSPHVDSRRKIGSHIFYLNTDSDWKAEWGGQTLVLDDGGEFHRDSNPAIDSFRSCIESANGENRSLIFGRGKKSWHAVRSLECPERVYRKIFIVRYEKDQSVKRLRKQLRAALTGQGDTAGDNDKIF